MPKWESQGQVWASAHKDQGASAPSFFEGNCKIFIFDHWCPPRLLETYSSATPVF